MDSQQKDIEAFWYKHYAAPFAQGDARVFAEALALPCIIRAEGYPRQVFTEREPLVDFCILLIAKSKEAIWSKSMIDHFSAHLLEDDVAVVNVQASRLDETGKVIARLYGNYNLNKDQGEWKMASIFGGYRPMSAETDMP
ncbi:hypothetical protein [Pseudomonas sp. NFX224]|uniref:hypothetical protein n=1 Tax=Pseudomonas sp. NFX224 TaxID=3402862 RepID=UPI003AFAE01C